MKLSAKLSFSEILLSLLLIFVPNMSYCQNSVQYLIPKVQDAVFTVYAELDNGTSQGSGFFITSSGMGVTNYHVLDGANDAYIKTRSGEKLKIESIVDFNPDMDIVKFKIENRTNKLFKFLNIQMKLPQKGASIVSLSTPIGLDQTVSTGIISAIRKDNAHGSILQITAPISHGSSGSPVLNMNGEVIGVATFGYTDGQSLNFAVAANQIKLLQRNLQMSVSKIGRNPLETDNIRNARINFQKGNFVDAIGCLDKELKYNKQNHLALYMLSKIIYNTLSYMNSPQAYVKDAITFAYQASSLDKNNPDYHYQIGLALVAWGIINNWQGSDGINTFYESIRQFKTCLKLDSTKIEAVYGLAKTLCEGSKITSGINLSDEERRNNFLSAIDLLNLVEKICPNEDCYNYLITANVSLKEYGKALLT